MTIVEAQVLALREYIVDFMRINQKVFDAVDYHQNKQDIIEFMEQKGLIVGLLEKYVDDRPFMMQLENDDRIYLDVLISTVMDKITVIDC